MALDDTRMGEIVSLLEEVYDNEAEKADAVGMYNVRIKDAKNTLAEWAKNNEIEPGILLAIYDQYKKSRSGKIQWSEDDLTYSDLLFSVMEKAIAK